MGVRGSYDHWRSVSEPLRTKLCQLKSMDIPSCCMVVLLVLCLQSQWRNVRIQTDHECQVRASVKVIVTSSRFRGAAKNFCAAPLPVIQHRNRLAGGSTWISGFSLISLGYLLTISLAYLYRWYI